MYDREQLGLMGHAVHPHNGEQVAWFETDSCHDYWVVWTYPGSSAPELVRFYGRDGAEEAFRKSVSSWPTP